MCHETRLCSSCDDEMPIFTTRIARTTPSPAPLRFPFTLAHTSSLRMYWCGGISGDSTIACDDTEATSSLSSSSKTTAACNCGIQIQPWMEFNRYLARVVISNTGEWQWGCRDRSRVCFIIGQALAWDAIKSEDVIKQPLCAVPVTHGIDKLHWMSIPKIPMQRESGIIS